MKRFITICVLLLSFTFMKAQTFTVTDIQFSNNVSDYEIQKDKAGLLGATVNMAFFENDVKVTLTANENGKKRQYPTDVFKKVTDVIYQLEVHRRYGDVMKTFVVSRLELETTLGFIKSAKIHVFDDNKLEKTVILKREIF